MAVASFALDELDLTAQPNLLVVSGEKQAGGGAQHYLHRGLVSCPFERRFELADPVKVTGASGADGLLTIKLLLSLAAQGPALLSHFAWNPPLESR